ncbi:uncharacterized protein LOC112694266 [Sipha flava]|uniref:Uncharacterized protein LOC112694266 n=1 Tax=Sipha flava TaxID=143950 RepID=A0A8B8GT69_9HEMI|nr:uncharacterized protein LOC112694266 [Sipha flava]
MIVAMERKLISELIEEYKSCTCLWRIKDPDYKNKEMKNEAYESLLQLIKKYNEHCTMDDLKRKIANLRTCYLREFKKVMDAKRYGGVYEPSLWYYKSLEFLNDQHQGEERVRLGRSYPDNSDEDNESNEAQILMYEDRAGSEDKDSCSTEPEQPTAASSLQMIMDEGGAGTGGAIRPKRRRRILDATGPPSSAAAAAQPTYRYAQTTAGDFYDPQILGGVGGDPAEPPVADYYDGFGRYAANELRQMDRQSVIIAKRLINEVLFLGQMGMLNVNTRIETPPTARRKHAKQELSHHHHPQNQQHPYQSDDSTAVPPVEFMETS